MDSLFSLEVVINYLKLNNLRNNDHSNPSPPVSCLFPSVAVRLLDYPTIAIDLIDEFEAKELKNRLQITQPFNFIEKLPCFTELLDINGRYIFSKGKSCLFRADLEVLKSHLRHSPMYLMILDSFFEPYKLVGSVSVPLTKLINEIYDETIETDKNAVNPCIRVSHGVMDIKNLMGETLGHVSFVVRLTSFGTSLLPHIDRTTEAVRRKQNAEQSKKIEPINEPKIEEKKDNDANKEVYLYNLHQKTNESATNTVKFKENALVQTVQIDYKDAHIQISELKPEKKHKFTQSPEPKRKIESKPENTLYTVKHEDEFVFNHYCPPPLKYNSGEAKTQDEMVTKIIEQKVFVNRRIEYLKHAVETEERFIEDDLSEKESSCEEVIEYSFREPKVQVDKPKINLDQMPLLKCLFEEISSLKNILENQASGPCRAITTKVVSNKIQPKKEVKKQPKPGSGSPKPGILRPRTVNKERFIETVERLSQPKNAPKPSPNQSEYDEIPVKGPDNLEIKKIVKKPLKYGITNTHRLRVLASRPNKVQQIEEKHDTILGRVKKNLDEINLSTIHSIDQSNEERNMQKNMEKILENTTGSLPKGTIKSTGNYSLLNRVEMESTYDTMNYLNTNLDQLNLNTQNSTTKMVQFGNTYVYDAQHDGHSDESHLNKEESEKSVSNRNIFLDQKNQYDNDFNSSLDTTHTSSKQSATSTSNFITANLNRKREELKSSQESKKYSNEFEDDSDLDYEEEVEEYHSGLLSKINQSDLKSSSKYSNSVRSYNSRSFLDESFSYSNQDY